MRGAPHLPRQPGSGPAGLLLFALMAVSSGCASTGSEFEDYLAATGRRITAIQDRTESMLLDRPERSLRSLTERGRRTPTELEDELRGVGAIQNRALAIGEREVRRLGQSREIVYRELDHAERDLGRLAEDFRNPARYRLDPEDEFARLARAIERAPKIFRLDHRPFPEINDPDASVEIDAETQPRSLIGRILRRLKP